MPLMTRCSFKPTESLSQSRCLSRHKKRMFHQSQIDKLPNEFKGAFDNYNHRNVDGIGYFDTNKYDF